MEDRSHETGTTYILTSLSSCFAVVLHDLCSGFYILSNGFVIERTSRRRRCCCEKAGMERGVISGEGYWIQASQSLGNVSMVCPL